MSSKKNKMVPHPYFGGIAKIKEDSDAPLVKAPIDMVFITGEGTVELFADFLVAHIDVTITDHLITLFKDVLAF